MENEQPLWWKRPINLLIALVGLLVITNVVSAWWLYEHRTGLDGDEMINAPIDTPAPTENVGGGEVPTTSFNGDATDPTGGTITINWNPWPVEISTYTIVNYDLTQSPEFKEVLDAHAMASLQEFMTQTKVYKIGTIANGPYANKPLILMDLACGGPCFGRNFYRFIFDDTPGHQQLIQLAKYSIAEFQGADLRLAKVNKTITIDNLEPTAAVIIPNTSYQLTKSPREAYRLLTDLDNPTLLFTTPTGEKLYKDKVSGCIYGVAADGTLREYTFTDVFPAVESSVAMSAPSAVLGFTRINGEHNAKEYTYKHVGGCGGWGTCYNYVSYITNVERDLEKIGTFENGGPVYRLKNTSIKSPDSSDKTVLQLMFDGIYTPEGKTPITFDEFIKQEPLLYWQDPFGQFIELRNTAFIPMAECGKPVIYLYPTKPTNVRVAVTPSGGFTETIPEYGTGWFVHAKPNGELYNYADKQAYPYLFWEGNALDYQRPTAGFVVKRENVRTFLADALAKQGLIAKEYDEFIEFWAPKMQDKPYYFVTFVPQAQFEQLAPLNVTPQPDTVIRVFMDYQGLDAPITVQPQHLTAPARRGFTVVEWGGALHR